MKKTWMGMLVLAAGLLAGHSVWAHNYVVNSAADAGGNTFTLRGAVEASNADGDVDTITFALGTSLTVNSTITITQPIVLDGGGSQVIGFPFVNASPSTTLLDFSSGSQGSVITGLAIVTSDIGLGLGSDNITVIACRIGTDFADSIGRGNYRGLMITGNACQIGTGNTSDLNVISGNTQGIVAQAQDTKIMGNFIGVNRSGTAARPNTQGVLLILGERCQLGGDRSLGTGPLGQGNLISGNSAIGVNLLYSNDNVIAGNVFGLALDMSTPMGTGTAIYMDSSQFNNIGRPLPNWGNVIVNGTYGIQLEGGDHNRIQNNLLGITPAGAAAGNIANIYLHNSSANVIGGCQASGCYERNTIGSATFYGVHLSGSTGNTICGNVIGLGLDGTTNRANPWAVFITDSSHGNAIGGTNAESSHPRGNVISGGNYGIDISSGANNVIQGNWIGTDITGTLARGSMWGVRVENADCSGTVVGGTDPGLRNIISSNGYGIYLHSFGHRVQGNYLGVTGDGLGSLPNAQQQIYLDNAYNCEIGGSSVGAKNLICGSSEGLYLTGSNCHSNTVTGNWFGLLASGALNPYDRFTNAVSLDNGAHDNLIGLPETGQGNIITNAAHGIAVTGLSSMHNGLYGNLIGNFTTAGITLGSPGNQGNANKSAPVITSAYLNRAVGTSAPYDFIEVFRANLGASQSGGSAAFLGQAQAKADGSWEVWFAYPNGLMIGDYVCALATDTAHNTSAFGSNVSVSLVSVPTWTSTVTPTLTVSPTPTSSFTPTPSPTQTQTCTITATLTASPTATPSPTTTPSPTVSVTPMATSSPTATVTPTGTSTATPVVTATPTQTIVVPLLPRLANAFYSYPNPARQHVTFAVFAGLPGDASVMIYNSGGERVALIPAVLSEEGVTTIGWDCQSVAPGIYFARLVQGGKELRKVKLAITH